MKKIIHTCFPAKLCPFPNRSSLPLPRIISYLPANIGVSHRPLAPISQEQSDYSISLRIADLFRQPQADIFHRRSRYISQSNRLPISITEGSNISAKKELYLSRFIGIISPAAGWPISQTEGLPISQDKVLHISQTEGLYISIKRFFQYILATFFLFLFLFGAPTIVNSQVADSPGTSNFPQLTKMSLRSGETRSTLLGNQFFDDSISLSQGSLDSPVSGEVLIYGELINPDSLGPLYFTWTPYFFSEDAPFLEEEAIVNLEKGEFYDGVSDYRIRKFSQRLELFDRPGYFSLTIGERILLEDFLMFPGDSLKINMDLYHSTLVFAGPDADFYEAQYALYREKLRDDFDTPMLMFGSKSSPRFQSVEKEGLIEKYESQFGSHFQMLELGKEAMDHFFDDLENTEDELALRLEVLDFYRDKIGEERYELLLTETVGKLYGGKLASFRKFHYPEVFARFSVEEQAVYFDRVLAIIDELKIWDQKQEGEFHSAAQLVSSGYLNLALEETMLRALLKKGSFQGQVREDYSGELADRLLSGYLSEYLSDIPNAEKVINAYLKDTETAPWRDRLLNLKHAYVPGEMVIPIELESLQGELYDENLFQGKPTLVYFYFSSCAHSADFFDQILYPLYQQTQNLDYQLIAISIDEDLDLWKSRIDKYSDPSIPNFIIRGEEKKKWRSYYEINAFPKTMLIDAEGKIQSFNLRTGFTTLEGIKNNFESFFKEKVQQTQTQAKL
ncbi:TlpA family protein disulfide reductase [Algoriphagus zhangzhouensis]|uniref:Thioredoxin-like n=1 Tax=Algoriphagus zhangzhouensis TaxID=1073327 RepID=A0A1M7ZKM2_9BACT|nr:thioredoxin family protein [Algoriphagus zhangzhouensis]TDY42856.1 thioredoxin-like protein [Algoriphagus zhangzhouensis]SHO65369.1 Thioredoxin-like [Algoriphagus zhangzhouensis]